MWWWDVDNSPLAEDEETLHDTIHDPFEDVFDVPVAWRNYDIDDRAEWERKAGFRTCKRCGESDVLDSLRHCLTCRRQLGRCSWCGVDKVVHRQKQACGACSRWLSRNLKTYGRVAAQRHLLTNGAKRTKRRAKP